MDRPRFTYAAIKTWYSSWSFFSFYRHFHLQLKNISLYLAKNLINKATGYTIKEYESKHWQRQADQVSSDQNNTFYMLEHTQLSITRSTKRLQLDLRQLTRKGLNKSRETGPWQGWGDLGMWRGLFWSKILVGENRDFPYTHIFAVVNIDQ